MVKVAHFDAIVEQHAIALPIETICQRDFPCGTGYYAVEVDAGRHGVAKSEVDLSFMRTGERMWFPQRHDTILTDGRVKAWHRPIGYGIGHVNLASHQLSVPSDSPPSPTDTLRSL